MYMWGCFSEPLLTLLSSPGSASHCGTIEIRQIRLAVSAFRFCRWIEIFFFFCSLVYFLWESIKFTVYPTLYNTSDNALVTRNTISATMKYTTTAADYLLMLLFWCYNENSKRILSAGVGNVNLTKN